MSGSIERVSRCSVGRERRETLRNLWNLCGWGAAVLPPLTEWGLIDRLILKEINLTAPGWQIQQRTERWMYFITVIEVVCKTALLWLTFVQIALFHRECQGNEYVEGLLLCFYLMMCFYAPFAIFDLKKLYYKNCGVCFRHLHPFNLKSLVESSKQSNLG